MTSDCAEPALVAARVGGEVTSASFRRNIAVGIKNSRTNVVTQTNRGTQREAVISIQGVFPEAPVTAEESEEPKHMPDDRGLVVPTETRHGDPPAAARGGNEAGEQ